MDIVRTFATVLALLLLGTLMVGATGCGGGVQDEVPDLSEMSEPDRSAALKQAVCPVSREALGSMGTPVKVTVGNRDVFLCCAGCEAQLRQDPDRYLQALDAAVTE